MTILLSDLDDQELLAFIGLAKQVIRADQIVSEDEKQWLLATADAVGTERWSAAIRAAQDSFSDPKHVRDAAVAVERAEAREAMHGALMKLAEGDEYVVEEARILDWLARAWSIGDHVPLVRKGT